MLGEFVSSAICKGSELVPNFFKPSNIIISAANIARITTIILNSIRFIFLFPDAEVVEDVGEDLVGGYIAHYVGKVVDAFAKVL